jgi:hypothetical protein
MSSHQLSSSPDPKPPPGSSISTSRVGIPSALNLNHQLSDRTDVSVKVMSAGGTLSSMPSSPSNYFESNVKSSFSDLCKSPQAGQSMVCDEGERRKLEDSDHLSWWGNSEKFTDRLWYNPPKKKKTVPSEQTEALQSTRKVSCQFNYYYLILQCLIN